MCTVNITPSSVERLLGVQIHQEMRWVEHEHVLEGDETLVTALDSRLRALKKLSQVASAGQGCQESDQAE